MLEGAETTDHCLYTCAAKNPASLLWHLYAIALGCDLKYASDIVYGDMLGGAKASSLTPIGLGCSVCERQHCQHRGSPPEDLNMICHVVIPGCSTVSGKFSSLYRLVL